MSDPGLDQLAESARNRGLKLVRSRVRTPGKRRFGKVGLADASGNPVFGMDGKAPSAKPEEVEDYLRNLGAKDWGASLDVAVMPRKRKARTGRSAPNDASPEAKSAQPKSKPPPRPKPQVRAAKPADAAVLVRLMELLEHEVDAADTRKRIAALARDKLAPLVATLDGRIVGLIGIHRMVAVHRTQPVGRITILVVNEDVRGKGVGRLLVEAAEQRLRTLGCRLIEVTSNDRLGPAHAFYRHMGYERTSIRFAKTL